MENVLMIVYEWPLDARQIQYKHDLVIILHVSSKQWCAEFVRFHMTVFLTVRS